MKFEDQLITLSSLIIPEEKCFLRREKDEMSKRGFFIETAMKYVSSLGDFSRLTEDDWSDMKRELSKVGIKRSKVEEFREAVNLHLLELLSTPMKDLFEISVCEVCDGRNLSYKFFYDSIGQFFKKLSPDTQAIDISGSTIRDNCTSFGWHMYKFVDLNLIKFSNCQFDDRHKEMDYFFEILELLEENNGVMVMDQTNLTNRLVNQLIKNKDYDLMIRVIWIPESDIETISLENLNPLLAVFIRRIHTLYYNKVANSIVYKIDSN